MSDDRLSAYREKRERDRTPEPVPEQGPLPQGNDNTFVIQEHHARRLHWDFRLERDGVLVSWALPKGLPEDPTWLPVTVEPASPRQLVPRPTACGECRSGRIHRRPPVDVPPAGTCPGARGVRQRGNHAALRAGPTAAVTARARQPPWRSCCAAAHIRMPLPAKTPHLSPASDSGHENGPVLTSSRAVASSVGPSPNDGHHRATPHAPHAGLRA
jgi:DNA polymerase Ligase (LigD)